MNKKIVTVLLLSFLALPALSSASGKAVDNPFERIWAAVGELGSRLTAVENDQAEREQEIVNLEERIDVLTACLNDEENCALGGGEEGGEDEGGSGQPKLLKVDCGYGECHNFVQYYEGEAVPECVPFEDRATPEICDGVDNDCNGEVDENYPLAGQACDENAYPFNELYSCNNGIYQCR